MKKRKKLKKLLRVKYVKILSIDSNYLTAYLNLYSFYLKQEKLKKQKIFEKIIELGWNHRNLF